LVGLALISAGCATSAGQPGFGEDPGGAKADPPPASSSSGQAGDFGKAPPGPAPEAPEVHEGYGQSATTRYKPDPATKAVTVVGNFKQCEPIIDIALDEKSTIYAVSQNTLYTVDKATAECTKLHSGNYPNSLAFVPKGTLDQDVEALVGYEGGDYIRI